LIPRSCVRSSTGPNTGSWGRSRGYMHVGGDMWIQSNIFRSGQGNRNRYLFILHRHIILLASSLLLTGGPNRQSGCFTMRGYVLLVGMLGCCSGSSFLSSHMISASLKSSVRTDRTRWEVLTLRLNFRRGLGGAEENTSLLKYICIWLGGSGHMHHPVTFILPDLYHK
jgi:hypothetical protein